MIPVPATPGEVAYWQEVDDCPQYATVIGGPEEGPEVIPCPALISERSHVVRVAWQLNEIELAALAQGGTLFLTTYGTLPIHSLDVIARVES